jgi:Zn finger protein HypA/HybF involved in hydrogenase expression
VSDPQALTADPVPTDERDTYDPGPCPNCGSTNRRVLSWHQPAGMEDEAIPASVKCDDCGRYEPDDTPTEVAIP